MNSTAYWAATVCLAGLGFGQPQRTEFAANMLGSTGGGWSDTAEQLLSCCHEHSAGPVASQSVGLPLPLKIILKKYCFMNQNLLK